MAIKKKVKYVLCWEGKRLPHMTFDDKREAITARHLETQQMEMAEYSPAELKKKFTIRKIKG